LLLWLLIALVDLLVAVAVHFALEVEVFENLCVGGCEVSSVVTIWS
jgi:hypothetical protein